MQALTTSSQDLRRTRRRVPRAAADFEEHFLAGHQVGAGIYHRIGSHQQVVLDSDGVLPASCDGRVAVYIRRPFSNHKPGGYTA